MTLNLSQVSEQVNSMGHALAEGARQRAKALPALRQLLHLFAGDQERLIALAQSPPGRQLLCASPTSERLDATFPAPELPPRATVLAADGSQIYPEPHALALYYAINVGSLVYRHGSGCAPQAASEPRVGYAVDADGYLLSAELLDARRDLAEMEKLAGLAEAEPPPGPVVALLDSTIGLRAWSVTIPQAEQERLKRSYELQLDRIRLAGSALAGVVSRSRRAGVVALLDLAQQEEPDAGLAQPSPFRGITDQMLWADLKPGERSALFLQEGSQPVYFFYLNCDPPGLSWASALESEPARIELPAWVALDPEKLGWVHTLVYDQCCINNGYPYALSRADELAIILNEEREALETMLLQAMNSQGMPLPRPSSKQAQKRIARAPARRRL